jgi:diadenylate cyclase
VPTPVLIQYLLGPGTTWREVLLACVDVAVVGYLIYRVLLLIRGTRAIHVLVGLFVLGIGYLASQWANLITLNWLLGHFLTYSFIFGVIVLFQADIRRGLAQLGRGQFLSELASEDRVAQAAVVEPVATAAAELSRRRHGALVVLERSGDLGDVVESGVKLDALCTPELLLSLFQPGGALHDGAVIIQGGRVAAASCLLPLTASPTGRELGTRHRAALGLTEEIDAAVVVVSEERGEVSLAVNGSLHRGLDEGALRLLLTRILAPAPSSAVGIARLLARLTRPGPAPRGKDAKEDHRAAV